jgi:sRNA-binding protein
MPKITPEVSRLLKHLCRTYPATFRPESQEPLPLAHGIHWEILDAVYPDVPPSVVRGALKVYCNRASYQKCLKPGAPRVNLKGEAAGVVAHVDAPAAGLAEQTTAVEVG